MYNITPLLGRNLFVVFDFYNPASFVNSMWTGNLSRE